MIHHGTLDQSPAMLAQHKARKQRLARFAQAAERQEDRTRAAADIEQLAVLERISAAQPAQPAPPAPPARREYQTAGRPDQYVSLTRRILIAVANEFGMPVSDMLARSHHPKFSVPRFVAIGLLLEMTRLSLPAIGQRLGGRDHTTIISGRRRIYGLLEGEAFRNRFEQIRAGIAL